MQIRNDSCVSSVTTDERFKYRFSRRLIRFGVPTKDFLLLNTSAHFGKIESRRWGMEILPVGLGERGVEY